MSDVVVVDDDFMVAASHKRVVDQTPGFTVVGVAHTAREALGTIERLKPQLVLLDIYLPDMSGLEVIKRVRAAGIETDFLVLTAAREADMVAAAMQGGIVSYVLKPFRIEELRQRLAGYMERQRILQGTMHQTNVDLAMGASSRGGGALPKGLSPETAKLVAAALGGLTSDISASECATLLGMSRVAVRKYLEHFVDTGTATVKLRYGQTGRPQRRYEWNVEADHGRA